MSEAGMNGASELKANLIPCGNCGKESSQCCGKCRKESFCSKICQIARRKQHKLICFPAKKEIGDGVRYGVRANGSGSFWVATRDIEEGEEIFTDYPLMTGPGQVVAATGQGDTASKFPGQQICLGCHTILKDFVLERDERKCGDCGWPLCGGACPGIQRHLKECESLCWMRENKQDFETFVKASCHPNDGVYLPIRFIRLLALMKNDPIKWESFLSLYVPDIVQNTTTRIHTLDFKEFVSGLLFFQSACRVDLSKEVMVRLGAAEPFHHRRPYYPRENTDELVIYDKETRMDMSCMENCYFSRIPVSKKMKDPNGIVFIAVKHIKKGERLIRAFGGNPQWDGTKRRREALDTMGEIRRICKCPRCCDPTELGTFVSAIKCRKCKSGHMLPLEPLDNKSKWKCDRVECCGLVPASDVDRVVNQIQKEADAFTRAPWSELSGYQVSEKIALFELVAKFVEKYEKILNPFHYILLNAQQLTIGIFTFMNHLNIRPEKPLLNPGLSLKIYEHLRIATIFLMVATKIFPPLSNPSLEAHFYMGMSKFFSAQKAVRNEETSDVVQNWLKEGISHRRNVMDIKIKISLTLPLVNTEGYTYMMTSLGEAYDNALELCRRTPNYSGIPENMSEFD